MTPRDCRGARRTEGARRARVAVVGLALALAATTPGPLAPRRAAAEPAPRRAAAEPAPRPAGDRADPAGLEARARAHLARGAARDAVELLRDAPSRPTSRTLSLLLARAYLLDRNDFWALRAVSDWLAEHDGDCEARQWLAWIQIRQGVLDEARASLAAARCPSIGPEAVRTHLLRALADVADGRPAEGRSALDAALSGERAYPEDRAAIARLRALLDPGLLWPVSGRIEAQAGLTSDARAGSPTDPASSDAGAGSAAAQLDASLRAVLPIVGRLVTLADLEGRALGYAAEAGRDLSYLTLSGRPAFLVGDARTGVLLGLRVEGLLLAGGDRYDDGPLPFSLGARGEVEVSRGAFTAFAGLGRRTFREAGRARAERDAGAGGRARLARPLALVGALVVRQHDAARAAYDLRGATALVALEAGVPRAFAGRLGVSASVDTYPDSRGFFDPDVARRDVALRGALSLWMPERRGLRLGLGYELGWRASSADVYEYTEHRVTVRVAWPFRRDPAAPSRSLPPAHVPLDYGLDGDGAPADDDRIPTLLRQDDGVRRGSSCVE